MILELTKIKLHIASLVRIHTPDVHLDSAAADPKHSTAFELVCLQF